MMKAAPAASLIVSEPDLLLELLIVALDAPAQFGEIDQLAEADLLRQGREPVFGPDLFAPLPPPAPRSATSLALGVRPGGDDVQPECAPAQSASTAGRPSFPAT